MEKGRCSWSENTIPRRMTVLLCTTWLLCIVWGFTVLNVLNLRPVGHRPPRNFSLEFVDVLAPNLVTVHLKQSHKTDLSYWDYMAQLEREEAAVHKRQRNGKISEDKRTKALVLIQILVSFLTWRALKLLFGVMWICMRSLDHYRQKNKIRKIQKRGDKKVQFGDLGPRKSRLYFILNFCYFVCRKLSALRRNIYFEMTPLVQLLNFW